MNHKLISYRFKINQWYQPASPEYPDILRAYFVDLSPTENEEYLAILVCCWKSVNMIFSSYLHWEVMAWMTSFPKNTKLILLFFFTIVPQEFLLANYTIRCGITCPIFPCLVTKTCRVVSKTPEKVFGTVETSLDDLMRKTITLSILLSTVYL